MSKNVKISLSGVTSCGFMRTFLLTLAMSLGASAAQAACVPLGTIVSGPVEVCPSSNSNSNSNPNQSSNTPSSSNTTTSNNTSTTPSSSSSKSGCRVTAAGDHICDSTSQPSSNASSNSSSASSSSSSSSSPSSSNSITANNGPIFMPGKSIPSAVYNTKAGGTGSQVVSKRSSTGPMTTKELIDKGYRNFVDDVYTYPDGSIGTSYAQTNADGSWVTKPNGGLIKGEPIGKIGLDGKFIAGEGYKDLMSDKNSTEKAALQSKIDSTSEQRYKEVMGGEKGPVPSAISIKDSTRAITGQVSSYVNNYAALEQKMWQDLEVQVPLTYEAALLAEYGPEYADHQASLEAARLTNLDPVPSSTGEPRTAAQIIDDYKAAYSSNFRAGWDNKGVEQSKSLTEAVANGTPPSTKIDLPTFQGNKVSW